VDLDLAGGDLAWRLGVDGVSATIADLVVLAPKDITSRELLPVSYEVPGLRGAVVVPSPAHPEVAETVEFDHAIGVLDAAQTEFEQILVDGGSGMSSAVLAACVRADHITVVTSADLFSQRQVRLLLNLLERAGARATVRLAPARGSRRRSVKAFARTLGVSLETERAARLPRRSAARLSAALRAGRLGVSGRRSGAMTRSSDMREVTRAYR